WGMKPNALCCASTMLSAPGKEDSPMMHRMIARTMTAGLIVALLPAYVSAAEQCLETNRLKDFSFVEPTRVEASMITGEEFVLTMATGCPWVNTSDFPIMEKWQFGRCIDQGDIVVLNNGGVCRVESVESVKETPTP
ncbi:MAG TPA: hypothetical protein PLA85_13075, partial [Micropepsaceae bacterium]|nr:hypothetical protein [Micropepsaceae bacterium]